MGELLAGPASEGRKVDMQLKFFNYTMDSILKIFFGEDADTLGGDENSYATAYDTAHRKVFEHCFDTLPVAAVSQFLPWPFGGVRGILNTLSRRISAPWQAFLASYRILDAESK